MIRLTIVGEGGIYKKTAFDEEITTRRKKVNHLGQGRRRNGSNHPEVAEAGQSGMVTWLC